jgi:hypothetical protein
MKHCLENKKITYYKTYVDDILIIFDKNKIDEDTIHNNTNNIDEHLEFKLSIEEKETINYLDLSINSETNNMNLNIYRKPTYVDIAIHSSSNHPYDHELAAFKYYFNRMITMPITEKAVKQEWNKMPKMAHNNGFPEQRVHKLKNKLTTKKKQTMQTQPMQQHNKKWVTLTYHGPSVRKVTNLFKHTNLNIAFRPTNTIYQQLSQKYNITNPSGMYHLKCNTCKHSYIGQFGRPITTRYKEQLRYIKKKSHLCICHTHIEQQARIRPIRRNIKTIKTMYKRHENELLVVLIHAHTLQEQNTDF